MLLKIYPLIILFVSVEWNCLKMLLTINATDVTSRIGGFRFLQKRFTPELLVRVFQSSWNTEERLECYSLVDILTYSRFKF